MLKGFRNFILRGNVVDLAVAFVVGAAFTAIVTALVTDIINPLIAATVGKPDFSYLIANVHGGVVKYGLFVNAVIYFVIVCAAMYFGVVMPLERLVSRFKTPAPPSTRPCPQCLSDIPLAATRCSHCTQQVA
jgi:large conductance mechanosensitive channel